MHPAVNQGKMEVRHGGGKTILRRQPTNGISGGMKTWMSCAAIVRVRSQPRTIDRRLLMAIPAAPKAASSSIHAEGSGTVSAGFSAS